MFGMKQSTRYWGKGAAGALALAAALVLGGCQQPASGSPDIVWTAQADGGDAAASTRIDFVFDRAVADLGADAISITEDTGSVIKGALSGSGREWSLGITVETAGDVGVSIAREGIDGGERILRVHKGPELVSWTALADGVDGQGDSTAIRFVLSGSVADLSAEDITITEDTGRAAKGTLAGSGKEWSLGITVETAGDLRISINRDGIETISRNVAVYKAGQHTALTWSAHADGSSGARDSTVINFSFSGSVAALSADDISVSDNTGSAVPGALTGSGAEWSLGISVASAGDVTVGITREGIEAGTRDVAVYKAGQSALITWSARANGAEGALDSTAIAIAFSGEVAGLAPEHLTVTNGAGDIVRGTLSGNGANWSLGITVNAPGTVTLAVRKEGVEAGEKTVAVHQAPAPGDIAYDAAADGGAATASTKIDFTFGAAVADLTAADISITNGTGAVTRGALTGSGAGWSLGIAVTTAGEVKVGISKAGIEAGEKTVAVYKAPVPGDIAYDAAADGGAATASTKIDFTFGAAVADLTAADISITNGTGAITRGALTGSGTSWSLGIAVTTAGDVKVTINKAGVDAGEKTVAVHKAPVPVDIAYDAAADGGAATASTKIDFAFGAAVADLTAADISITNGTGAAARGALTGSGTSWSLGIAVTAAGTVKVKISKAGIEAGEKTVTVYKAAGPVDIAYDAAADGGAATASTKIDFAFGAAVADLTAADISITNGTGAAARGALTGSGTSWSLGIAVTAAGTVKVTISKAGVEAGEKTVTVHKAADPVDIAYDASADGGAATASTKIDFAFGAAVSDLTAADISITNGTGAAARGTLTGSGTSWSLGISATTAGTVKVKISKAGIEAGEKTVAVYKASDSGEEGGDSAYDAAADGGAATGSSRINLTFSAAVTGLTAENISITNGTGAAAKGALTGSGTSWSLGITVSAPGSVKVKITKAGIESTEKTVTVYKAPDLAYDAAADGGSAAASSKINLTFSAAATGLTAADISVANGTGAAVKGALTGSGTSWSLGIAVSVPGTVKVKINKAGIEATEKTVTVHTAPAPADLAYDAAADGGSAAASSKINLTFSSAATGLTAADISITNGTGAAARGALTGSGTSWSLGITVSAPGTVKVTINKAGIEAGEKTVTVHAAPAPAGIAYDAAADGGAATGSGRINLTFSAAATGLTAENISIANGTGAAARGALTGSGTSWSLGITVSAPGTVKVTINKAGIEAGEKTVTVYKAPDIAYDAAADGGSTTASNKINLTFSAAVTGLTANNISITNGTGAAAKGALTGSGTSWSLGIAVAAAGTVKVKINKAGIVAGEKTVTVYKPVDVAYAAAADGGPAEASAAIAFVFDAAVAGLTAADIGVANGTGAVTKGALSGSGTNWSLGISVVAAGDVKVAINKAGIEAGEKTVTVHKPVDVAYAAAADGADNTASSTVITLSFDAAVAGLTAGDISVANDTGSAVKGALTGSGTSWSLAISVAAAGNVKVRITKAGIESAVKNITLHKAPVPDIVYTAEADDGNGVAASSRIDFVFSEAVTGLTAGNIALVNDTGSAAKGALTGSGTGWSLGITVAAAGNVRVSINKPGVEAGEKTVAVHRPLITYDAAADSTGGTEASARIDFIFSEAVEDLGLGNIRYADATGSAVPISLTGNGQEWSLEIVTISSGDIKISIEKDGIEDAEKTVAVYKPEEEPPEVAVKTGIVVISPPDTVIYAKNQPFDPTGLEVGWAYSDGSVEPIPAGEYQIDPPDMSRPTTKRVYVRAGSYTASFWIQALNSDKALVSISVEGPDNKTQDFGKNFDRTGLKVTGHYSDGSTSDLTSLAAIAGYDKHKRGSQAVSVKVNGKTVALEGILTRIGEGAAVGINRDFLTYNKQQNNYKDIYIKGEAITPRGSNIKVTVNPTGINADAFTMSLDNGCLTEEDFNTLTGYNPYQTGWQRPSITVDGRTIGFHVRVVDVEPAVWFDYGYMRHDGDPGGHGPGAGKYYAQPNETLVIAPVRYLLGYNADHSDAGASYAWTVSGDDSSRTWTAGGELLYVTPKTAGTYTITVDVTGRDYVSGSVITKTAATELVCYAAAPLSGGTFASPLRNFAPGQFTDGGNGYGWSLGSIGGYMVWTVDPSQSSYEIRGNPFGSWHEAGVVWMQEDNNDNGLPDEMWYELRGGDDDDPALKDYVTRRYAVTWFKGDGTIAQHGIKLSPGDEIFNRVCYWVDCKGRAGLLYPGGFPSKWGVTGTRATYTSTLLRDDGRIGTGNYDGLVGTGYVDTFDTLFPVSKAVRADGMPANLTAVKFIKVQTGMFRYGGLFGEVSTEVKYADGLGYLTDFPDP
jgi:hypothetical protein